MLLNFAVGENSQEYRRQSRKQIGEEISVYFLTQVTNDVAQIFLRHTNYAKM